MGMMDFGFSSKTSKQTYVNPGKDNVIKIHRLVVALLACLMGLSTIFVLLLLFKIQVALASPEVIHVEPNGNSGGATPCLETIQAAIDAASEGDVVKVAQGVYTTTDFQVAFIDKSISLFGGYNNSDWELQDPNQYPVIIDSESESRRRGIYIGGSSNGAIEINGIRIQHGNSYQSLGGAIYISSGSVAIKNTEVFSNTGEGDPYPHAGGIYIKDGDVTIVNSKFKGNYVSGIGGGLFINDGTVIIENNLFEYNGAPDGAAIYIQNGFIEIFSNTLKYNHGESGGIQIGGDGTAIIRSNDFISNTIAQGAGIYAQNGTVAIDSNNFTLNYADYGGGVKVSGGNVHIIDNTFKSNQATEGGAIFFENNHIQAYLARNLIISNTALNQGGGLYFWDGNAILESNEIISNTAYSAGGAMALFENSNLVGMNDIIANNTSPFEGIYVGSNSQLLAKHWTLVNDGKYAVATNDGSATILNSIVATHTLGGFSGPGIVADHSLFYNSGTSCMGGATCTSSVTGNPLFVDYSLSDFHIAPDSAAIDSGVNAGVWKDIDNEPRIGIPDIGADEYWPPGLPKYIYLPLVTR